MFCPGGGCFGFTTVPVTKTIRLSEWVTPGDTAIPGMTSLKDGDLQHSSALAPISKGDIEPKHPSEINPNSDSRSRSDGRSRRFVQYRVDQSQGQRPRSLLTITPIMMFCPENMIIFSILNGNISKVSNYILGT